MSSRNGPAGRAEKRSTKLTRRIGAVAALAVAGALVLGTSSAGAAQYWLNNSKTVASGPGSHCISAAGYWWTDMLPTAPTGSTSSTYRGTAAFSCSPALATGGTIAADNSGSSSVDLYFTNTNKKACNDAWFLMHNAQYDHAGDVIAGTTVNGTGYITVPGNTKTPTKFTQHFNVPQTTLGPNDQLVLQVDQCNSYMTMYYGSASAPTNVSLPTLVANP